MAKRVNKRFLIILTVAVAGLLGMAVVARVVLSRGGSAKALARAQQTEKAAEEMASRELELIKAESAALTKLVAATQPADRDSARKDLHAASGERGQAYERLGQLWKETHDSYLMALGGDQRNVELLLSVANARHERARFDPESIYADIKTWELALEVKPDCRPALNHLLDAYLKVVEQGGGARSFQQLRQRAEALAYAEPGNVRARACQQIGILGAWLSGTSTPAESVNEALVSLEKLLSEKSDEWIIPWHAATACLRLAAEQGSDPDAAAALRQRALKAFEEARKVQPLTPALAFHEFRVSEAARPRQQRDPEEAKKADREEWQRLLKLLEEATVPASEQDRYYTNAWLARLDLLGKLDQEEQVGVQLLELACSRPFDLPARIRAGHVLGRNPATAPQAIELLTARIINDPALKGVLAALRPHYELERLAQLIDVRVRNYLMQTPAERVGVKQLIDAELAKAESMLPQPTPQFMVLKAKVLLLEPGNRNRFDAIRLMQQAVDMPKSPEAGNPETLSVLAANYHAVGQTGDAVSLLSRVLRIQPHAVIVRLQLADLLLSQRMWEQAKPHVEILTRQLKDADPENARQWAIKQQADALQIRVLMAGGQREEAGRLIQELPEKTIAQQAYKGRLFLAANETAAGEKLLKTASEAELAAGTGEFPATNELMQLMMRSGRKDEAKAMVAAVREKNPNSTAWRLMEMVVEGKATQQEIKTAALDTIKNPVMNALQAAQFRMEEGKAEEGLKLLQDAEKKHAGEPLILEAIFNAAIALENWPVAEQYVRTLEQADVDRAGGAYFRAVLKLKRGDSKGAMADAEELTRKLGELSQSWALLGMVQQAQRRFEDAVVSYAKALEKQLDNVEALRGLVVCHVQLGQIPTARQYTERGTRIPAQAALFTELGRVLEEEHGDALKVTADREKAVAASPESSRLRLALVANYQRVAASLRAKKDPRAAEYAGKAWTALNEASVKWPDAPDVAGRLDMMSFEVDKPEEGLKALQRMIEQETQKNRWEPLLLIARHHQRAAAMAKAQQPEAAAHHLGLAEQVIKDAVRKSNNAIPSRLYLARFHLDLKQTEQAVGVLRQLWTETQDVAIRRDLVTVLVDAGRFDEAEQLLRKAISEQRDVQLISLLAFVKYRQGQLAEAGKHLSEALKLDPAHAASLYYRGMIHMGSGDSDLALADLVAARNLSPGEPDMRLGLAELYWRRKQAREAIDELEQALQGSPLRQDVRVRLLQYCMAEQRWWAAERLIAEAKANPEMAAAGIWHRMEAQMWLRRGDLGRAFESARAAMRADPQDTECQYLYLDVLLRAGKFEEVVTLTEGASKQPAPQVPWQLHVARATALKKLPQKPAGAEAAFDAALSSIDARNDDAGVATVTPAMLNAMGGEWTIKRLSSRRHPRWAIQLAEVHASMRDLKKASEAADGFIAELEKLPPEYKLLALKTAGMIYTASATTVPGTGEKAVRAYVDYLEMLEKQRADMGLRLEALNNLACLLAEHPTSPNPEQALTYSRKAYEMMRQANAADPNVMDTHGWVLVLSGKVDEGIAILLQAAATERTPPDTFYHLGEAYLKKQALDLAESNLQQAQDLYAKRKAAGAMVDAALEGRIKAALAKVAQLKPAPGAGAVAP